EEYIHITVMILYIDIKRIGCMSNTKREIVKREFASRFVFLDFDKYHFISAIHGSGIKGLFPSIDAAYAAAMAHLPTPKLTRALLAAVAKQAPPRGGMSRPKLRYAHQGGSNPPLIIIHGSMLNHVPETYRRYLENMFRETFQLVGTPLRVEFRTGHNPYANKKPAPLTEEEARRAHSRRRRS